MWPLSKNPPKTYTPNKGQKKSTVQAIEELRRNREERRRSAEQYKKNRAADKIRFEKKGQPGDVDFQRMIETFRKECKYKKRSHRVKEDMMKVCIRKRPIIARERRMKDWDTVTGLNPLCIIHKSSKKVCGITKYLDNTEFSFDHVFDEVDDNALVYKVTTQPLLKHVFSKGGNATVFAYGQTGSGKTYTMVAMQNRAAEEIFQNLQQEGNIHDAQIICAFFEIYGGRCIDLLNRRKRLTIREDGKGNVVVGGLQEVEVSTKDELLECISRGNSSRATHATEMNAVSSRSHAICRITVRFPDKRGNGMFSLIDLAGSERGQDTKNHNRQRRVEGAEINKSLLALKECIRAQCAKRRAHIPYRASKLTLVLKDSFSPRSLTTMICNIAPTASSTEHTLNTLRYADRVKQKEVVHYFEGTMAPGGIVTDENRRGQNNKNNNVGALANNNFGDVLEEDDDTIGESMMSPPLSPTARRLHRANVLAREGKISENEKIKLKEDVIRSNNSNIKLRNNIGKADNVRAPSSQTNNKYGNRSPRVKLPPTGSSKTRKTRQQQNNDNTKYEGKMDDKALNRGKHSLQNGNGVSSNFHRHAPPPGQKEETKKPSGPNHPSGSNSKRRIVDFHNSENSPALRGGSNQRSNNSKLKKPSNIHQKLHKNASKSKNREDLHILHRSLRAQGEGESNSHLEDLHEAISQLVDEEENLLQLHMDTIQENAQLLTEEGNLLAKVQGEDVVDYDIDVYAERLDNILERKIKMYTELQKNLKTFRSHLAEEETLSAAFGQ
jgi:kinesin family member 2/24